MFISTSGNAPTQYVQLNTVNTLEIRDNKLVAVCDNSEYVIYDASNKNDVRPRLEFMLEHILKQQAAHPNGSARISYFDTMYSDYAARKVRGE